MDSTTPVDIPSQLQTLSRYVHEELEAAIERADARAKIAEFYRNIIQDDETRKTTLTDANARSQIIALLERYESVERSELDRFKSKFGIIEQMLTMMSTLVEKGREGSDYTLKPTP